MEEQRSVPLCKVELLQGVSTEKKDVYIPPKMESIVVELENNIAAGSITLKETNEEVQESWQVEDDIIKDIEIDLF
ncbi:hypothetical protein FXV77_08530 [Sphingobacterium phlebotomi]|uniref:Uncharacterized protein n=1 Tax=Sphingobacterium phlebotomi TaxID=2605433 RepID=A0A5D4HCK3_9SPHI|nr:hypothetical protein [Sphingobacterium phlebotomi]TYR36540.1 hypothetical protein FXV77_08530 [Sphingobacterium phlebotomi]